MKEVYQLCNTNNINVRYKIQSRIAHKFIMNYYRKYFVKKLYILQIASMFDNFIVIYKIL